MTAIDDNPSQHQHPKGRFLQIARHRVLRWFRPPEAELRRARLPHYTLPGMSSAGTRIVTEGRNEQSA